MKAFLIILILLLVLVIGPTVTIFYIVFKRVPQDRLRGIESNSLFDRYNHKYEEAISFINNLKYEEVEITSYDNLKMRGLYYDGGFNKTIIFMHGYHTKPLDNFYVVAKDFYSMGYNLLFPYERAHGKSEGKFICLGLKEQYDLLNWIDFLNDKTKEMVIYGMSLGSGVVGFASSKIRNRKVKTLVMDCGFSSPYTQMKEDAKKHHLPWFLVVPFEALYAKLIIGIDVRKSVSDSLKDNEIPTFFLHGGKDKSVYLHQGEYNYDKNKGAKEMFVAENAEHTACYLEKHEEAKEKLFAFIDRYSEVK